MSRSKRIVKREEKDGTQSADDKVRLSHATHRVETRTPTASQRWTNAVDVGHKGRNKVRCVCWLDSNGPEKIRVTGPNLSQTQAEKFVVVAKKRLSIAVRDRMSNRESADTYVELLGKGAAQLNCNGIYRMAEWVDPPSRLYPPAMDADL